MATYIKVNDGSGGDVQQLLNGTVAANREDLQYRIDLQNATRDPRFIEALAEAAGITVAEAAGLLSSDQERSDRVLAQLVVSEQERETAQKPKEDELSAQRSVQDYAIGAARVFVNTDSQGEKITVWPIEPPDETVYEEAYLWPAYDEVMPPKLNSFEVTRNPASNNEVEDAYDGPATITTVERRTVSPISRESKVIVLPVAGDIVLVFAASTYTYTYIDLEETSVVEFAGSYGEIVPPPEGAVLDNPLAEGYDTSIYSPTIIFSSHSVISLGSGSTSGAEYKTFLVSRNAVKQIQAPGGFLAGISKFLNSYDGWVSTVSNPEVKIFSDNRSPLSPYYELYFYYDILGSSAPELVDAGSKIIPRHVREPYPLVYDYLWQFSIVRRVNNQFTDVIQDYPPLPTDPPDGWDPAIPGYWSVIGSAVDYPDQQPGNAIIYRLCLYSQLAFPLKAVYIDNGYSISGDTAEYAYNPSLPFKSLGSDGNLITAVIYSYLEDPSRQAPNNATGASLVALYGNELGPVPNVSLVRTFVDYEDRTDPEISEYRFDIINTRIFNSSQYSSYAQGGGKTKTNRNKYGRAPAPSGYGDWYYTWDWGRPGYCRQKLLNYGFTSADLTP